MKRLLRRLFDKPTEQRPAVKRELEEFVSYVKSEISEEDWSLSLRQKIQTFERLSQDLKVESLPGVYLLFEKSSLSSKRGTKRDWRVMRREFKSMFPALAGTRYFQIVFVDKHEQEKELSQLLIRPVEKKSTEIVGDSQSEIFQNFDYQVKKAFEQFNYGQLSRIDLQSTIKYEFTNLTNNLSEILGERKVADWIQASYQHLTDNFKFLDTFSFLVALLPESILDEQQLSLLSRTQIENVLIDKTEKLEQINNRLRTEIEEKEEVRQELNENAQRLNKIIESAMDAVVLMDEQGKVVFWNSQAEEIFGWKAEEVVGKKLSSFIIPKAKVEAHEKGLKNHLATGRSKLLNHRIEEIGTTKNGQEIPLELSIVSNKLGESKIFTAFIRDISERKKYEQNLMDARDNAERASRAKAEFLSTMSHEIRTPMNGLVGTIELLLTESPREDQIESLNLMKHSTDNLLVILNDILDFSKIEDGHVEFDSREFSIAEVCARIISTYKPSAQDKGIKLFLKSDNTEYSKHLGDPVRLSQILNNLISNAIKFTQEGEVELRVEVIGSSEHQSSYQFTVIDTGIGIPKESIRDIFQRFTQLRNEHATTIKKGTGLGLAIAKNLLLLQGSDLQVKSTYGKGSKFYFEMTFDKVTKTQSDDKFQQKEERDLSGLKILLVEDNKVNQIVAAKFLSKWNCAVSYANNGLEAVEAVRGDNFDLVLMDLQMPVMDGYQAAEAIRKMDGAYFKEVPIIALTADVLPEIKQKVQESQMNDFMPKPFDPEKLYFTITSHLKFFKVSK